MGRKNHRVDTFVPLDLTPAETSRRPRRVGQHPSNLELRERSNRDRDAQRLARMKQGIDWSVCIVPGCGRSLMLYTRLQHQPNRRDSDLDIPICYEHAAIVWNQLAEFHTRHDRFIQAVADVNEAMGARDRRESDERKARNLANVEHGEVYFIRLGDLIKVGWTRDLWSRLKSYGASAVLLIAYPGSLDDETNLHRQLSPARAKGREWYHDGPIIQRYITEALAKYGEPPTFDDMWTQPKRIVAGKRH